MMAKYLFDKKITPACKYCFYVSSESGAFLCEKKGSVNENDKCMRFKYDPTLREPKLEPLPTEFSAEDFKI